MKKIFTSILVLAAGFTAAAQNFTVTGANDATYSDGDVINVGYVEGSRPGTMTWNPELVVHVEKASITGSSTYTVSAIANYEGKVQFCGIDGQCYMLFDTEVTKSGTYAAGSVIPLEIDILNQRTMIPQPIEVKVTITDGTQTSHLTVNFLTEADQSGIDAPSVAAKSVRISDRTLYYSADSTENLTLYNISGRTVLSRNVSGTGTLSLCGVPAGVYVYRLGSATGKLLVR